MARHERWLSSLTDAEFFALPQAEFMQELRYRAFKHNRAHYPEITVEDWERTTIPNARQWEFRRWRELKVEADRFVEREIGRLKVGRHL